MNSQIVLGLWPIAGITTVGVTPADARRTLSAAIDAGVTTFDTAYSYGYDGESDRLLGQAIGNRRDDFQIIGKVGQRWTPQRQHVNDGSARTLISDAQESLRRIGTEYFDTLMLHSPGDQTPIEESALAIESLHRRGLCRRVGVCNVTIEQYRVFAASAPCAAIQCPLNLLQRGSLNQLIPSCHADGCSVYVYWALMKGLLAGKITRDHQFDPADVRPSYPIFQGQQRERTHRVLDALQSIADDLGTTIAQLAIGWTVSQPGVTAALVGARYPEQIRETAAATTLDPQALDRIESVIASA